MTTTGFISVNNKNGRWRAEFVRDFKTVTQLRKEAGLGDAYPDPDDAYDRMLAVAGKYGLGLEQQESA